MSVNERYAYSLAIAILCMGAPVAAQPSVVEETRAACAAGDAEACALEIVMPRPVDAARFRRLEALCRSGNPHACGWAGVLRHVGEGTRHSSARAIPVLERACEAGVTIACMTLGAIYADDYWPREIEPDEARSRRFFGRALELQRGECEAGDNEACRVVAGLYHGRGVERDDAQRWAFLTRACSLDNANACEEIGTAHWHGAPGIALDLARGAPFLVRACTLGHESACREGPQIVIDHVVLHPADAWPDRASLDALLTLAQAELARDPARSATNAAIGAIHLRSGRAAEARAAFEAGLAAVNRREGPALDGVRAPYVFGIALALDALQQRGPALSHYEQFVVMLTQDGSRPWLMLPRAQGIDPDAALAHARARIEALRRRR